jgi:hypothetical protein
MVQISRGNSGDFNSVGIQPLYQGSSQQVSGHNVRKRRDRRDLAITDILSKIDAASDQASREALIKQLSVIYEQTVGGALIALLGKCCLGAPYVDHELSLAQNIITHFSPDDELSDLVAAARPLAQSGAYAYVEIYSDGQIVPVLPDGLPVVPSSAAIL